MPHHIKAITLSSKRFDTDIWLYTKPDKSQVLKSKYCKISRALKDISRVIQTDISRVIQLNISRVIPIDLSHV